VFDHSADKYRLTWIFCSHLSVASDPDLMLPMKEAAYNRVLNCSSEYMGKQLRVASAKADIHHPGRLGNM
jgi:hypothetical protein